MMTFEQHEARLAALRRVHSLRKLRAGLVEQIAEIDAALIQLEQPVRSAIADLRFALAAARR